MNIYESIAAIMQEGYAIGKNNKNVKQGYKYRGIDDVMNVFQPLMSKYKVFCVPQVLKYEREERRSVNGGNLIYSVLWIKYSFYAEDGSSVDSIVIGEGMDSGDKASNKAMAVGMKYAMFQTFCIPTEEMRDADPDSATPDPSTPAPDPASAPKAEAPKPMAKGPEKFTCADCGNVITPWIVDGHVKTSIRQIAHETEKRYSRPLCLECGKKAKEAIVNGT